MGNDCSEMLMSSLRYRNTLGDHGLKESGMYTTKSHQGGGCQNVVPRPQWFSKFGSYTTSSGIWKGGCILDPPN